MELGTLTRYSPLYLKDGIRLRNRVVIPPMASGTATKDGMVTSSTLNHYARLTEARAGLLIVEYTFVDKNGRSEEHQLGISEDRHVEGLKKIAITIQNSGALAGIQLTHSGGKSNKKLTGGNLMGPSSIVVPVRDQQLETPDEMTIEQIKIWKEAFILAAVRAYKAGFNLIEIHAAHGYGLNQWLSPITNQRNDLYGGCFENRSRLLIEIISEIRKVLPEILISVRIPGQDFLEGGISLNEGMMLARKLESFGVNLIHVSSGIGGWRRPRDRQGEGYLTEEAAHIQKQVSIPVIGVGGIQTGAFIDSSLQSRRFSLAAVGRAILENPKQWNEINFNHKEAP